MSTSMTMAEYLCCMGGSDANKHWSDGKNEGDATYQGLDGNGGKNGNDALGAHGKKICVPQKIDPKTFFANERTFLKWLSISTMVGLMSLALMNYSDRSNIMDGAELAGLVLLPVSLLFMLYSLFVFRQRANRIYMREPMRYDDTRGPTLLVTVLAVSLILSTLFSLQRHYNKTATLLPANNLY